MSKKRYIVLTIVILCCSLGYGLYTLVVSPTKSLKPIYVIPSNAVFFIETEEPISTWEEIRANTIWKHLKKQTYFSELTENANTLDTLFQENKKLFKLLGSRALLVSAHMYKKNDYDFLFVVDLQKISKFTQLKDYLDKVLSDDYSFSRRIHDKHEIIELLDKTTKETLYITILDNLLVASYTNALTEAAIAEYVKPVIGRDQYYLDVFKKVGHDDMLRLYVQQNYLDDFAKAYMDVPNESLQYISDNLLYSGFSFDLDNDLLKAEGYTNFKDTNETYIEALHKSGLGKRSIAKVAPQRTAFYLSLGFDDFERFYENFQELKAKKEATFQTYDNTILKTEKFLDISVQDQFISWMDDEIAFLQLQSNALGKKNEFAVVLKAKDGGDAKEELDFVLKQIKKKTPVKFRQVSYRGYAINFMAMKGFFKPLLGRFFKDLDKPYFTIIEDYVIFSNHPQTLKDIINDFEAKNTLTTSKEYKRFSENFDSKSNMFAYLNMPLFYKNISTMLSATARKELEKNKAYITCFSQIGLQLSASGAMFESKFTAAYRDPKTFEKILHFTAQPQEMLNIKYSVLPKIMAQPEVSNNHLLRMVEDEEVIKVDAITPDDLNAKKYKELYKDGTLKVSVPLKKGLKHGVYRKYFPSGTINIKGRYKKDKRVGVWKVYDKEGNTLERKRY